jgi:uncharacterized protein with HEPN domain
LAARPERSPHNGEHATSESSAASLAEEPTIPWIDDAGMRSDLAHRYFDTAHSIVQATLTKDLPPLVAATERLLKRIAPDPQE